MKRVGIFWVLAAIPILQRACTPYIHMYICIHLYMYIYIHTPYAYADILVFRCTYIHMYMYTYTGVYKYMEGERDRKTKLNALRSKQRPRLPVGSPGSLSYGKSEPTVRPIIEATYTYTYMCMYTYTWNYTYMCTFFVTSLSNLLIDNGQYGLPSHLRPGLLCGGQGHGQGRSHRHRQCLGEAPEDQVSCHFGLGDYNRGLFLVGGGA